ncbi:hypothetical protein [Kitasatospora sp. GP82]|uniref:hypothetical protein n=1 Tax=Kitasatospora sp. GP82 TaxID=3035089 RepID=UPI002473918D|nr:hypothetical protein [Kitasatospora sp. GP82]MDH6126913.1 hypothetical protein [Kitasatospora sp. GP82]
MALPSWASSPVAPQRGPGPDAGLAAPAQPFDRRRAAGASTAERFDANRARPKAVAYRMLGSLT